MKMKKSIIIACLFALSMGTASAAQSDKKPAKPGTTRRAVANIREFGKRIQTSSASEAVKKAAIKEIATTKVERSEETPFEIALTGALTTFTGEFDTRSAFADVYTALSQTTDAAEKLGVDMNTEIKLNQMKRAGAEAVVKKMRDETLKEDPEGKNPNLFDEKMKAFEDALGEKDLGIREDFEDMSKDMVKKVKDALEALRSITTKVDAGTNEAESIDSLLKMAEDPGRLARIKAGGPEAERQAAKFLLEKIVEATKNGARTNGINLKESLDALGRVEKMFGENTVEQAARIAERSKSFKNAFDSMIDTMERTVEVSKGGWFGRLRRFVRRHTETKDGTIQDSIDSLSTMSEKGRESVVRLEVRNMLEQKTGSRGRYTSTEEIPYEERMQTLADYMEALSKSNLPNKEDLLKSMVKELMDVTAHLQNPMDPNPDYEEIRRTVGELIKSVRRYNLNDDLVNIITDEYKAHLHELMTNDVANSAADGLGLNQRGNSDETAQDAAQSERDAQNAGDRAATVSATLTEESHAGPDVTGEQKSDPQANNNGKISDDGGGSTVSTVHTDPTTDPTGLTDAQIEAQRSREEEELNKPDPTDPDGDEEGE